MMQKLLTEIENRINELETELSNCRRSDVPSIFSRIDEQYRIKRYIQKGTELRQPIENEEPNE